MALTGGIAAVGMPAGFGSVPGPTTDVEQIEATTPSGSSCARLPSAWPTRRRSATRSSGRRPWRPRRPCGRRGRQRGLGDGQPRRNPCVADGARRPGRLPLEEGGATVVSLADVADSQALRVGTGMPVDTRIAASVGSTTTAGDLRGLAAASCTAPDISQWLVGGSTEVGSSAQLVLQNPGRTPATVRLSVWGRPVPSFSAAAASTSSRLVRRSSPWWRRSPRAAAPHGPRRVHGRDRRSPPPAQHPGWPGAARDRLRRPRCRAVDRARGRRHEHR
ncbi:DUF5719 family protein [Oerskovia sp. M15]